MTTQVKNVECYSACVYAFMGGAYRYAGEGSLAIDRAMFDGNDSLTTKESLHEFGGSLVDYSVEMGVDPNVLKLAGSVPDGNPHFLTESEMKQYLVTTLFIDDDGKVQPALETTPKTAQTQRPGNAPLPETPVRSATPEQRAQDMMLAYLHALRRGDDEALDFLQRSYADKVKTDDGMTSKAGLLKKKQAFFKQWPVRFYSSDLGLTKTECKATCAVSAFVMWYWKNAATGEARSGMLATVLNFDPKTNKIIGDVAQLSGEREEKFGPTHMIASWGVVEGDCRLQSGDPAELKIACQVQQEIEAFLADIGWCYGIAGKARNERWHECAVGGANGQIKVPQLSDYPASQYKGKSVSPDFKGRDVKFRNAATIIRDEMREGPNFAGHYRLIKIDCNNEGCPMYFVVNHKTGKPIALPRHSDREGVRVGYRPDSRLMFMQYISPDSAGCMIDAVEIAERQDASSNWRLIDRLDIGDAKACDRPIMKNLTQ
ncbi:hypothetical protein HGO37_23025 [Rhizobium sp. CG4]|uniref:hypothetical protein n=1 Tax=Rhizobium sp. CG4 TaxID=2726075 RepID=UPI002034924E|nr:hypothetical protein [Rhizobium sp. CG4]MCM2458271.1 hypothetical protein [Rhizobium sp. CG4]